MKNVIDRVLFSEEMIAKAVKDLGETITKDYAGTSPLLICILKGSFMFMADLARAIDLPCETEFMIAKSYGNDAVSSGKVNIVKDIDVDIKKRHVILVEDILDSGRTLYKVKEYLKFKRPASISVCAFLEKRTAKACNISADYKCFDVDNEFVVGYGLDYAERYRNLPYVGVLKREIYENRNI